ncbi:hypothetical protein B0G77_2197 [Paraburkholderia sp. BL10I2N1]|nr:hypothetical protein B0G77_2197 [Paraburkholderia sp. BL10I2N1]
MHAAKGSDRPTLGFGASLGQDLSNVVMLTR